MAEGDYDTAYTQFRSAFTKDGDPVHYHVSYTVLAELAAAAARRGRQEHAAELLERSARRLGEGMSARVAALIDRGRALLADPEHAEPFFQTALADPMGEQWPFERAQTRLDYGEWLRRRRRIAEARPLLSAALETFQRLGARPWIERAQAELRAAGIEATDVMPRAFTELSPQQQQIVRLAARGLTNREIGEKLFLSPRTVGSHLYWQDLRDMRSDGRPGFLRRPGDFATTTGACWRVSGRGGVLRSVTDESRHVGRGRGRRPDDPQLAGRHADDRYDGDVSRQMLRHVCGGEESDALAQLDAADELSTVMHHRSRLQS
nr:helix-turn-helix transcriptional regulator [Actinomadura bangladeshensis]